MVGGSKLRRSSKKVHIIPPSRSTPNLRTRPPRPTYSGWSKTSVPSRADFLSRTCDVNESRDLLLARTQSHVKNFVTRRAENSEVEDIPPWFMDRGEPSDHNSAEMSPYPKISRQSRTAADIHGYLPSNLLPSVGSDASSSSAILMNCDQSGDLPQDFDTQSFGDACRDNLHSIYGAPQPSWSLLTPPTKLGTFTEPHPTEALRNIIVPPPYCDDNDESVDLRLCGNSFALQKTLSPLHVFTNILEDSEDHVSIMKARATVWSISRSRDASSNSSVHKRDNTYSEGLANSERPMRQLRVNPDHGLPAPRTFLDAAYTPSWNKLW